MNSFNLTLAENLIITMFFYLKDDNYNVERKMQKLKLLSMLNY